MAAPERLLRAPEALRWSDTAPTAAQPTLRSNIEVLPLGRAEPGVAAEVWRLRGSLGQGLAAGDTSPSPPRFPLSQSPPTTPHPMVLATAMLLISERCGIVVFILLKHILAEGARALPVTLCGGVLFAS